jgi:2-oxoglutarate dehydrogenase E2 component (dihydrolipoamide succinyltransferase)
VATGTQIEVVMPQMGVSVSEGTITKWYKQPGDAVARDEALLEISTDKVDTEVPSPGEGIVAEIRVAEGETVEVGTVLAVIAPADSAVAPEPTAPEPAPAAVEPGAAAPEPRAPAEAPVPLVAAHPEPEDEAAAAATASVSGNGRTFISPVVARIASEHGVDPGSITGTGTGGRVTKKDILAFIEAGGPAPATVEPAVAQPAEAAPMPAPVAPTPAPVAPAEPAVAATPPPPVAPPAAAPVAAAPQPAEPAPAAAPPVVPTPAPAPARQPVATPAVAALQQGEVEEPMTAMRRGVMEHMRRSLDTSAHVSSAIEVDMSRIVAARERLKKEYQAAYGVNPTYLAFIAHATVETLKDYPWINAEIRGETIVTRAWVNLGIAVALEDGKGLIVPVIKNAQDLNLLGTARAIADLATRARTKKLLPDDVQGGTFTITNPGGFGTFHGTPIISQPQVGILGTYALVKRPWVVQDELGEDVIAIRPLMNITLTYDHRLVDGALSGGFLRDLRERLENWHEE